MTPERTQSLLEDAVQIARDIESLMRQEMLNGHLSPTDSSVLQRASSFLRKNLKEALTGGSNGAQQEDNERPSTRRKI